MTRATQDAGSQASAHAPPSMAEPSGKRPISTKIGLLVLSLVIVVIMTSAGGFLGVALYAIFGGLQLPVLGAFLGFISGMVLSYAMW
jgi:hypothetical protein